MFIQNFEISEPNDLIEIALLMAHRIPEKLLFYIHKLGIKMTTEHAIDKSTFALLEERLKPPPWDNPLEQIRLCEWMVQISIKCSQPEKLRKFFIEQQSLIFHISKLEPRLRYNLTQIFMDLASVPEEQKNLQELQKLMKNTSKTTKEKETKGSKEEIMAHIQLAILLFTTLPLSGKETYLKALNAMNPLRELRIGQNQRLVLETLLKIKECSLAKNLKFKLINLLFESEEWNPDNFRLVRDLLAFKAEYYMKTFANYEE